MPLAFPSATTNAVRYRRPTSEVFISVNECDPVRDEGINLCLKWRRCCPGRWKVASTLVSGCRAVPTGPRIDDPRAGLVGSVGVRRGGWERPGHVRAEPSGASVESRGELGTLQSVKRRRKLELVGSVPDIPVGDGLGGVIAGVTVSYCSIVSMAATRSSASADRFPHLGMATRTRPVLSNGAAGSLSPIETGGRGPASIATSPPADTRD